MDGNLKIIADKLCASCKIMPDNLKSTVLIKTSVVKWLVSSDSVEVQTLNKLANTYIDAISRESNPEKIRLLQAELDKLNKKMAELTKDDEVFLPVTNPELKDASARAVAANDFNVCMFKDHGKTNLCTMYHGIQDETGKVTKRPTPCLQVGSEESPCPWHHPEKYGEIYEKTRALLAMHGYADVPQEVIQRYIAQQYNLNEVFAEKIWEPYLKTLNINV